MGYLPGKKFSWWNKNRCPCIAQGTDDIIVPEFISQEIHDKYCTLDTPANKKLYPNADHSGVLKSARNDVLSFVRKRFDKKEFFSSCK